MGFCVSIGVLAWLVPVPWLDVVLIFVWVSIFPVIGFICVPWLDDVLLFVWVPELFDALLFVWVSIFPVLGLTCVPVSLVVTSALIWFAWVFDIWSDCVPILVLKVALILAF